MKNAVCTTKFANILIFFHDYLCRKNLYTVKRRLECPVTSWIQYEQPAILASWYQPAEPCAALIVISSTARLRTNLAATSFPKYCQLHKSVCVKCLCVSVCAAEQRVCVCVCVFGSTDLLSACDSHQWRIFKAWHDGLKCQALSEYGKTRRIELSFLLIGFLLKSFSLYFFALRHWKHMKTILLVFVKIGFKEVTMCLSSCYINDQIGDHWCSRVFAHRLSVAL